MVARNEKEKTKRQEEERKKKEKEKAIARPLMTHSSLPSSTFTFSPDLPYPDLPTVIISGCREGKGRKG